MQPADITLFAKELAIRWVDSYGRVIQSQVLQLTKPSRP
jgi:hypothetical protein